MINEKDTEILFDRFIKISSKNLSLISILRLFNIFLKLRKKNDIKTLKTFINEYYSLEGQMPEEFYELVLNGLRKDNNLNLFLILVERNIYLLISYLKHGKEDTIELNEIITPTQYYNIPRKHINKIIAALKSLQTKEKETALDKILKNELIWKLKIIPHYNESEYKMLAYKIHESIGLDSGLELLSKKYGDIDYEKIFFLFSKLDIRNSDENKNQSFQNFIFGNKKDYNNVIRQMISGEFKELFLNFDYYYNNFNYFVDKLGTKPSKEKVKALLDERYMSKNVSIPDITGDILEDMISSYYCKYDALDTPEEIYNKNYKIYDDYLRKKYKSSIPMINLTSQEPFLCEIVGLSDPKNLVLGYRAGNCFRINGDASVLFHSFLQSEHMRLLSISTPENKDFAMMLIMRNGNVLIGQGIEVSKWAPSHIKGKKLYDVCRTTMKQIMEYMNSIGDEIVATIIGNTNSNVSNYNNQLLPFLINPILENSNNYYNGICNYQCLLDISEDKTLQDIKLYAPSTRYFDKREPILKRNKNIPEENDDHIQIEKRLISLRFLRTQSDDKFAFYKTLLEHNELYTCCNKDWYITLFDDGTIDSFLSEGDPRAKDEYEREYEKIQQTKSTKNYHKSIFQKYKSKTLSNKYKDN